MSEAIAAPTAQDAYDWGRNYFAGQRHFVITGEGIQNPTWSLLTLGHFCILTMPKRLSGVPS